VEILEGIIFGQLWITGTVHGAIRRFISNTRRGDTPGFDVQARTHLAGTKFQGLPY
jgi:hypothetical protein